MYTTIEADLDNGRVTGPETAKLPAHAQVLITLLQQPAEKKPDWDAIKPLLGKLKLRVDAVEWQRNIRSEWD